MYYGGFTYKEAYNLPVVYKRWWIERIVKELNRGEQSGQNTSRGLHHNTPEAREMMGMQRSEMPSRLRRFT